ncbi:MAG: type II CRISPR-associated endonuclease Cas1, partial [Bacteroidetes bacterium]|nr:type II CRISPR-associated endonuclease Cas1 [Bacteroidota bacterium]
MIKRTLYFGNPAYLSKTNNQLVIKMPVVEKSEDLPDSFKKDATTTIPIEDIGVVVLDHQQITISQALLHTFIENNVAVVCCDNSHIPTGLLMPLSGNTIQAERFKSQIEASEPLKKQLWQQTITAKILNQAALLNRQNINIANMEHWADSVKSGDTENHEARAAAYFWKSLFPKEFDFKREREGLPPNNLLNYGYAILRAVVARCLVASGLLPTLGIHHHNRYNAYALADDIMEPYRPYVDEIVVNIITKGEDFNELNTSLKKQLLSIPVIDVIIDEQRSPLMIAVQRTTTSLVKCFEG